MSILTDGFGMLELLLLLLLLIVPLLLSNQDIPENCRCLGSCWDDLSADSGSGLVIAGLLGDADKSKSSSEEKSMDSIFIFF